MLVNTIAFLKVEKPVRLFFLPEPNFTRQSIDYYQMYCTESESVEAEVSKGSERWPDFHLNLARWQVFAFLRALSFKSSEERSDPINPKSITLMLDSKGRGCCFKFGIATLIAPLRHH